MFPFDNSQGYPGRVKVYFNGIIDPTPVSKDSKSDSFEEIKKHSLSIPYKGNKYICCEIFNKYVKLF